MRQIVIAALLVGSAAVAQAQAQAPAPVLGPDAQATDVSEAKQERIEQSAPISKDTNKPGAFSTNLFSGALSSTTLIRLDAPDTPHAHGVWDEVFVIKDGAGTLTTGGKIVGQLSNNSGTHPHMDANGKPIVRTAASGSGDPGGIAGTAIEGGHDQQVAAGDVILVPAGLPHVFTKVDKPILYLDIKFPQAAYVKDVPGKAKAGG